MNDRGPGGIVFVINSLPRQANPLFLPPIPVFIRHASRSHQQADHQDRRPHLPFLILPQINHLTNAAFLGHLGEFPIAVNGIAGIYTLVIYMISFGLSNGMQVMFARRTGEQNIAAMGPIFSNGLILSLGMAFLGILVTETLAPAFFRASLHDPHIIEAASEFTRIRIWGSPSSCSCGSAPRFTSEPAIPAC